MKTVLLGILCFALSFTSYATGEPGLRVEKTFTDSQIRAVERQAIQSYGVKVQIRVLSRNARNEITNLSFVRYGQDGKEGGGCSSDKFGVLLIMKSGCQIADAGFESRIPMPEK
ncbi:hypothetical protein F5984_20150 [Rudanella paleaurantiibacter]|uniref:Uncharacterized protein n=1 Tax=Rudanella paleaurantiibacter TaxID=2614655 RepID=A0A7J5TXB1_9BACT|nr:hypothetical protein [Rudanella paleaurantiibacter]KAB7728066.1 hypothetical protein F5984_20150 [Rudanella paleaurantiibacter]